MEAGNQRYEPLNGACSTHLKGTRFGKPSVGSYARHQPLYTALVCLDIISSV